MVGNKNIREIFYYKRYYLDFFESQPIKVQKKLNWTLMLIRDVHIVPNKYFKLIQGTGGIYEVRIEVDSNIFRVFCFFEEGNWIILCNGFQKKTQRTPRTEIERAERIKKEFTDEKIGKK